MPASNFAMVVNRQSFGKFRMRFSRTIRIFVSSTFSDTHAERDHPVTVVFPELRERVELLGSEFFDVDLRWGGCLCNLLGLDLETL